MILRVSRSETDAGDSSRWSPPGEAAWTAGDNQREIRLDTWQLYWYNCTVGLGDAPTTHSIYRGGSSCRSAPCLLARIVGVHRSFIKVPPSTNAVEHAVCPGCWLIKSGLVGQQLADIPDQIILIPTTVGKLGRIREHQQAVWRESR